MRKKAGEQWRLLFGTWGVDLSNLLFLYNTLSAQWWFKPSYIKTRESMTSFISWRNWGNDGARTEPQDCLPHPTITTTGSHCITHHVTIRQRDLGSLTTSKGTVQSYTQCSLRRWKLHQHSASVLVQAKILSPSVISYLQGILSLPLSAFPWYVSYQPLPLSQLCAPVLLPRPLFPSTLNFTPSPFSCLAFLSFC